MFAPFCIPTNSVKGFKFVHVITNTCYYLKCNSHPNRYEILICIFLMISNFEYFFICPVTICISSLENFYLGPFLIFSVRLLVHLLLSCRSPSIYIQGVLKCILDMQILLAFLRWPFILNFFLLLCRSFLV